MNAAQPFNRHSAATLPALSRLRVKLCLVAVLVGVFSLVSCGGGSDDTVSFEGTVVGDGSARIAQSASGIAGREEPREESVDQTPVSDVEICCFGECGISGPDGAFSFGAVADSFVGGDVLCTANGETLSSNFVVPSVVANPQQVILLVSIRNGVVTAQIIEQSSGGDPAPNPTEAPPIVNPPVEATATPGQFPEEPSVTPTSVPELPEPTPTTAPIVGGCTTLDGTYAGNNGCQIGTVEVSTDGTQVFVAPFGVNGSTTFTAVGSGAQSDSNNLTLFGQPGHSCDLTCTDVSNASFTLTCSSSAGSCSETFTQG